MSAVGEPGGLLVVAEYPGAEEDRKGEPLCGESGRFIRKLVQTHWHGPFALDNAVRCFIGSTHVQAQDVEGAYRRWYSGPMIRVLTADDRSLTGTPNHPVLTLRGWVALGDLVEGDHLIRSPFLEPAARRNPDVDNVPTRFDELFSALAETGITHRRTGANVDFHGDGGDSDVDVVGVDRILRDRFQATFTQQADEVFFESADDSSSVRESSRSGSSRSLDLGASTLYPPAGRVRSSSELGAISGGHARVHVPGRLPDSPNDESTRAHRCSEIRSVDAELLGERIGSFAGQVPTGDVVKVERFDFSGHVFNLQTAAHWYVASGYIVHNCAKGREKLPTNSVDQCRGYLLQTIKEVRPQRILAMGSTALMSFFGEALQPLSMRKSIAWLLDPNDANNPDAALIPVFLFPNPVMGVRNRFVRWWLEEDVKWALTVDLDTLPKMPVDNVCNLVETEEDAREAEAACRTAGGMTYDVENAGRVGNKFLKLVSVSATPYGTDDAYVWTKKALANTGATAVLSRMLEDPDLPKSGSFLKHDHEVSAQVLDITVQGTDVDVRLQRKLLEPHCSGRLADMGYLVGMGGHKEEMEEAITKVSGRITLERKKTQRAHDFLPGTVDEVFAEAMKSDLETRVFAYGIVRSDLLYRYNALDTIVSERLRRRFAPEIAAIAPVHHIWQNVVKNTVEPIAQVEAWGVPVDMSAVETFRRYIHQKLTGVTRHFTQYNANPSKPQEMAGLLYDHLHLPCTHRTKEGERSTEIEALEELEDKHPIVPKLIEWRTLDKLRGTYADGLLKYIRDDGRIHPSIDAAGASTGRTSSKDPNLQNQPRAKTEDSAMARRVFCAGPGRMLVSADYSQLEYRVAAMRSGDKKMKQIFLDGLDMHLGTARLIARDFFQCDPSEVTKEMRSSAKNINFGVLYNMQDETLAKFIGVSVERAREIKRAIMGEFSTLNDYIKMRMLEGEKTGMTWTYWAGQRARRRSLYQIGNNTDEKKDRSAARRARNAIFNTEIQGSASDYCVASLIESVHWIRGDAIDAKLIMPVHDQLLFEVDDDAVDEVCHTARDIMLQWDSGDVPLVVDVQVGKTWGDLKDYGYAKAA